MKSFTETSVADRQRDAAAAKKAALEKHRSVTANPDHEARLVTRDRITTDRNQRIEERKIERLASEALEAAERAAQAAVLAALAEAERVAGIAEAEAKADLAVADEAQKKEARDARYAARKARKNKRR